MAPLLSVIIPCYNNGNYLVKMIDCFRKQTSADWEMIIVDDGSTDDTPSVVKACVKDLPNVQYLMRNREPKGSVVCRNIGFELSRGKYVCHLDADDLVSGTFVEHRVAFMEAHPDVDYASFVAMSFSDDNQLPKYGDKATYFGEKKSDDILKDFLNCNYPFSVWNNIYKRESLNNLAWDEIVQIYTDFSFIVPCILSGLNHTFAGLNEVDYYYRISHSSNQMTSSFISDKKAESTLYLFEKTIKQLQNREDYKERLIQFYPFIVLHFKRLILSRDENKTSAYIQLVANYYPNEYVEKFKRVHSKCLSVSDKKLKTVLYKEMWKEFDNKEYLTMYIHALIRRFIWSKHA